MRHPLTILTLFTASLPLLAGEPIKTQWLQLCTTTAGRQITISTSDGSTVRGTCASASPTDLTVQQSPDQVRTVERTVVTRISMNGAQPRRHYFLNLHKNVGSALEYEAQGIPTPLAPFAIAAMPVTIAGGWVASPFALIFDLFDTQRGRGRGSGAV